jgi:2-methylisocitrate lyase-like PEP mutase family enzyme
MKLELQKSEITMIINGLKLLRAHQGRSYDALKSLVNDGQVKYGMMLVDSLRQKLEKAIAPKPKE